MPATPLMTGWKTAMSGKEAMVEDRMPPPRLEITMADSTGVQPLAGGGGVLVALWWYFLWCLWWWCVVVGMKITWQECNWYPDYLWLSVTIIIRIKQKERPRLMVTTLMKRGARAI